MGTRVRARKGSQGHHVQVTALEGVVVQVRVGDGSGTGRAQGKAAAAEEASSSSRWGVVGGSHTISPPWAGGARVQMEYTLTECLLCAHPRSKRSHTQASLTSHYNPVKQLEL